VEISGLFPRFFSATLCALTLFIFVVFASAAVHAQQEDSTVEWKLILKDLDRQLNAISPGDARAIAAWRSDAESLRGSLASFAETHPEIQFDVPEALPESPSRDQLNEQLKKLTTAVDDVIRQSPGSPFHLGTQSVVVSAENSTPALVADSVDQTSIQQHDFLNIAKAFDYLPGVEIEHIAPRNEAGIRVRGFTTRGQVPFYLDGIPISVPYDGFVDFNRFLTSDVAELQVTKGYSSPLLGPNALGGTINLVTIEPLKKFEGEALIGTGSGNTLLSSLRLGTRWQHFFVQGSLDWLQQDYIPLSNDFQVNQYTRLPDIVMTDHLNHSATRDDRYSGRIGWTPRAEDQYVFSYITQKGQKGVPLYQGPNTAAAFNRFWLWPFWDMNSYYFHSSTGIGERSSVNFRAFYNQFKNAIDMFSNDKYVITTPNAERSIYDEHTDGASSQFTTRLLSRNVISGSFFFKDDTHREYSVFPRRSPFPFTEPELLDRDQQISIGLQDSIKIASRLQGTVGFSADHFNGMQGEFYNKTMTGFLPFICTASPTNTSVSGCTLHTWNYNPQASLSYQVIRTGNLFVTFSDQGRFPMLKDIYSAGLGSALPNPDLKPEHSRNWNFGYSQAFATHTVAQIDLFRSDLTDAIESVAVTDTGNPKALNPPPATALCPTTTTGFCNQNVNIGKEVHEGVELKVQSTVLSRLTLDGSYAYINRWINYDFSANPNVSQVRTSVVILPTLPRNKLVGTATARLPRQALAFLSGRYEGGLTLQDTTYASTSPLFRPFSESFGTMDIGAIVPIYQRFTVQAGIKNLLDRNYYYVAGYPEEGRNWYLNLRYQF
jgi:iron complex outermembrane recepter protein